MKFNSKMIHTVVFISLNTFGILTAHAAAEHATPAEAEAMVKKVVQALKGDKDKVYAEITNKEAKWVDRDLYPVVYTMGGKVMAHGQNAKQVGKELLDFKDADGKPFVKERVDLARANASFWQDYKFTNPETKKIEPKQMYCELLAETAVCGGIYK